MSTVLFRVEARSMGAAVKCVDVFGHIERMEEDWLVENGREPVGEEKDRI